MSSNWATSCTASTPAELLWATAFVSGDPHWTVGAAIDVESQAEAADAVQVEIQTRARYEEAALTSVRQARRRGST